ncbi:MAG: hypothetical protein INF65_13170 [Roseomonas sp.]|nr:hypothetical protein [Roseomonas sp.]MCA3407194.1 hypothetical protein [Roseomonas sp.]
MKTKIRSGQRGPGKSQSGASKAINVEATGEDILTLGERAAENKPETSMVRQGLTDGLRYLTAQEAAKLRNQGLSSFWRQESRFGFKLDSPHHFPAYEYNAFEQFGCAFP